MSSNERKIVGKEVLSDDTISEEEYGSSSEEEEPVEVKKTSYSHSRFSSNVGDLEDELENLMTPNGEIDQVNLQINGPSEHKKLINDKR